MTLRERLSRGGGLLLDGAVGTELSRRGCDTSLPLWSARALAEDRGLAILEEIHRDYARAGADVMVTNTFRTTVRALARAGWDNRWILLNRRAVDRARAAARTAAGGGLVAGSIAPLEDCYRPDLVPAQPDVVREHLRQVDLLARLGVDFILIETMNSGREALGAVLAVRAAGMDALLSLCPGSPGKLLSGEPIAEILPRLLEAGGERIRGILLNCAPPETLKRAYPGFAALASGLPHGLYAHLGEPDPVTGWRLPRDQDPDAYALWMQARRTEGASILGGCCGTTPAHIKALHRLLDAGGAKAPPAPA